MFQGRAKLHNLLEHQNAKMSLRGCQHARTIFLFMKLHFMKPQGSLRIHPDRISWRGLVFVILRHGAVWILLADSGAAEKLGNGGEKWNWLRRCFRPRRRFREQKRETSAVTFRGATGTSREGKVRRIVTQGNRCKLWVVALRFFPPLLLLAFIAISIETLPLSQPALPVSLCLPTATQRANAHHLYARSALLRLVPGQTGRLDPGESATSLWMFWKL